MLVMLSVRNETVAIIVGLRQEDTFSTLLFNIIIDQIIRDSNANRGGYHTLIGYADDRLLW